MPDQHQRRISKNRVEVTVGTHSIFVDDETSSRPEDTSEAQSVSNDVAENTVVSDTTSEVVQESQTIVEASQSATPIPNTLE